jgi:thiamine thiazole synthase
MDVKNSEALVVDKTGEIFPGLYAIGMAVATVFGIPRMGPTFAGMLFSGRKAARAIIKSLTPAKDFSRKEAVAV